MRLRHRSQPEIPAPPFFRKLLPAPYDDVGVLRIKFHQPGHASGFFTGYGCGAETSEAVQDDVARLSLKLRRQRSKNPTGFMLGWDSS